MQRQVRACYSRTPHRTMLCSDQGNAHVVGEAAATSDEKQQGGERAVLHSCSHVAAGSRRLQGSAAHSRASSDE